MEYLIVRCSESRKVLVDGTSQGSTNELLELACGTYTIRLDPATGCQPSVQTVVLANTSIIRPCEVTVVVA